MSMFFQGESIGSNDLLKSLYELFASARVADKFSPHLQLLLNRLSDDVFSFLFNYFVSAGKILFVFFKEGHDNYRFVAFLTILFGYMFCGRIVTSFCRTLRPVRCISF